MAYGKNSIRHGLKAMGTKKSNVRPRTKQKKGSAVRQIRVNNSKRK